MVWGCSDKQERPPATIEVEAWQQNLSDGLTAELLRQMINNFDAWRAMLQEAQCGAPLSLRERIESVTTESIRNGAKDAVERSQALNEAWQRPLSLTPVVSAPSFDLGPYGDAIADGIADRLVDALEQNDCDEAEEKRDEIKSGLDRLISGCRLVGQPPLATLQCTNTAWPF
jgi:hypothetical protein